MKTVTLSESFVLEAYQSACKEWKQKIKKELPELFKYVQLQKGNWYKYPSYLGGHFMFYFNGDFLDDQYGFKANGNWSNNLRIYEYEKQLYHEATQEEVQNALIQEAKKRGLVVGAIIVRTQEMLDLNRTESAHNLVKIYHDIDFIFIESRNSLEIDGRVIFIQGHWATVKDTRKNELQKIIYELQNELNNL